MSGPSPFAVEVLGPLRLVVGDHEVDVAGTRRRALLALLAMSAPSPCSVDQLVDALWPDGVPRSGRAALQSHVSRLRGQLGDEADRLLADGAGYRLDIAEHELDATVATAELAAARKLAGPRPDEALPLLAAVRDRWRGPALADLRDVEPLAAWAETLTEAWRTAIDLQVRCALATGDAASALQAAHEAVRADPTREEATRGLAEALAAQGRRPEALRALHRLRQRLRDETGLDPSPALAQLEARLALGEDGDPGTVAPRPTAPTAPTARPRPVPAPVGPLLGRHAELAGLDRLVAADRLVSIVGPGGVGKTRLALELAQREATRTEVVVLELATVTEGAALVEVLARALDLEAGQGDLLARCARRLDAAGALLLLDNCEHLLVAARDLTTSLLARCPDLRVLATSRERLGVPAERTCRLAPLELPPADAAAGVDGAAAVALFLDRARRARPGFEPDAVAMAAIGRIVRALDGMPLAIELAAGRLSSLTLGDLEARLDRALDLLSRGASASPSGRRHQTLRAAVHWSYDLLPPDEQRLFRHLAAFPGGFDLATAEFVAAELGLESDPAAALAHLVDASVVVADLEGGGRYRMLDTLRRFGLDRLDDVEETEEATDRLVRAAVALAREVDAAYESPHEADAIRRLREERANVRAGWHAARAAGDLTAAAAIGVDLYGHSTWQSDLEFLGWVLELAADPVLEGHPAEAAVLGAASEATWKCTGDLDRAEALARRAVGLSEPEDRRGWVTSRFALADVHLFRARYEEGERLSLEARSGTHLEAEGHAQAAIAAVYGGDDAAARRYLALARELVRGPTIRAYLDYIEGERAGRVGDWPAAMAAYQAARSGAEAIGATFLVGIAEVGLVSGLAASGEVADALEGYRRLLTRWERTGSWTQQWTTLRNLADLLDDLDDSATARALRAAADAAPEAAHLPGTDPSPVGEDPPDGTETLAVARAAITRALSGRDRRP